MATSGRMGSVVGTAEARALLATVFAVAAIACIASSAYGQGTKPAPAAGTAEKCRSTGEYPPQILEIPFTKTHRYENPHHGIQYRYFSAGRSVSVYRYDYGHAVIDDAHLDQHFKWAIREVAQVAAKHRELIITAKRLAKMKFDEAVVLVAMFEIQRRSGMTTDFVALSHDTKCLLKIRYTLVRGERVDGAKIIRQFQGAVETIHKSLR